MFKTGMVKIRTVLILIGLAAVLIPFIYGATLLGKKVSYSYSYEEEVRQTVRDMVKPEYLKTVE